VEAQLEENAQMSDPTPTSPQDTPVPTNPQKSWWPVVAGFAFFFVLLGFGWWWMNRDQTPEPIAEAMSASEDVDPATMTEAEPVDEPDAEEVEPEEAAVSEPKPTPEPVVAAPAPEPPVAPTASAAPAATTAPDPTNCTFINGNRPQVGDKYVLTCAQGEYLATGEYKGGGVFAFSDFAPHTP
jgi:hypothetical protein